MKQAKKDKQKIMAKYTKLVAKRLYGVTGFDVRFDDLGARGINLLDKKIHSQEFLKSMIHKDINKCRDLGNYIGYDTNVYSKDKIDYDAWLTIIHEVTHCEIRGSYDFKKRVGYHDEEFKQKEEENLQKVKDLRKKFNNEVAWKDMEYAKDYDDRDEQYQEEQDELMEAK